MNELQIMVTVGEHPNVVSLIGACTRSGKFSELNASYLKRIYSTQSKIRMGQILTSSSWTRKTSMSLRSGSVIVEARVSKCNVWLDNCSSPFSAGWDYGYAASNVVAAKWGSDGAQCTVRRVNVGKKRR